MKGSTRLFRIFGIDIKLHFSWWLVFILIAWSLSDAFFPEYFPGHSTNIYWLMGLTASLLLFVSVLLHELSHSLVARAKKIKVESITLFFFGGVAGIDREDMKPSSELMMALAGPLFSLVLSGIFFLIYRYNGNFFLTAITFYLFQLNLMLALFNLIPGFPLDGGRALRAILYAHYKDLRKATKIAVMGGRIFAGVLIFLGIFGLLFGTGSGLWFILLGGFLYFIAGVCYEQVVIKEVLSNISVKELTQKQFLKLNPEMLFSDFVRKYAATDEEVFVVHGKGFTGILDTKKISKTPLNVQKIIKLKQVSLPLSQIKPLHKEDNAYTAFKKFTEQNMDCLSVMDGNKLAGIITRRVVTHRLVWELKFGSKFMERGATEISKKFNKT